MPSLVHVYLDGIEVSDWIDIKLQGDPFPVLQAGGVFVEEGCLLRLVRDCRGRPIISSGVLLVKEYRGVITLEANR